MKRNLILSIMLTLLVSTALFSDGTLPYGSGTENDPYLIETLDNLLYLSSNDSLWIEGIYFSQISDIDAADTQNWNDGAGFSPIGNDEQQNRFYGNYDGNGHTISNLYINRPDTEYVGLFGYVWGASIQNLGLVDADVTGLSDVGALVGWSRYSSIVHNCYSSGNVTGTGYFGHVGGLVGYNSISTIGNSYSSSSVTGPGYSGRIGGLTGFNYYSAIIVNSYSTGSVSGSRRVGGLVGQNYVNATISNSYSTGSVTGNQYVGGLVGNNSDGSVINSSYWNIETSGQAESDGGDGRTTEQMTFPYAANTYAGWDFAEIWAADQDYDVNDGYPFLREPTVSVDDDFISGADPFTLRNYPNPFNPETTIGFYLPHDVERLELKIYNMRGQLVRTLYDNVPHSKGEYQVVWNGENDFGKSVSSGVYFYRMTTPDQNKVNKMLMLK
jgi:hypothetical protein